MTAPPPRVRDDPLHPDPAFADLYGSLPDATDLEPWLTWCREAGPGAPVLYLGVGAGRLAVPLAARGVTLVGVDAHPGMLARLRARAPGVETMQARIEELALDRRFGLVIAPSNILCTAERLAGAARHVTPGGRCCFQLMNPHWLRAGAAEGVDVLECTDTHARIEVTYPGGAVQEANVPLIWPRQMEAFLDAAGLGLVRMAGSAADLDTSATFYVEAVEAGTLSRDDP